MARPLSGTPEGDRATEKWRATMAKKYGENWHNRMVEMGRVGGTRSRGGGFSDPEVGMDGLTGRQRASVAGRKGGQISRRGKSKHETIS